MVLAALLFAAFPKVLLGLHSFVYRDYGVLAYPFIHYAHESFWRGELPLWNPLSNCGAPFLAQWGTMTLYPFSIIYLLFPLPWSLSLFCLGHLALGGMGMFFLARRWTDSSFAAAVAGVTFVFNGVTLSCLMWPNYLVALGWMPWVIGTAERAWREGRRSVVLAALAGAMQMLAGVPEIAGFTWLLALALWLHAWCSRTHNLNINPNPNLNRTHTPALGARFKSKIKIKNETGNAAGPLLFDAKGRTMAARLVVVILLVAGLTAVQLLPFFDLLEHSQRDRSFALTKWALPGWGWANLVVPLFHCFQSCQGPFVQHGQAFFSSCYLGIGTLALGIVGGWRARHGRAWILIGVTLFGAIAALGENGHLYTWMKQLCPWIGVGRYPVKFMVLAAFALPLLGAFAVPSLAPASRSQGRPGWKALVAVGSILGGVTVALLWFTARYPFEAEQWSATWQNAAWRLVFLLAILGAVFWLSQAKAAPGPTSCEGSSDTPGVHPSPGAATPEEPRASHVPQAVGGSFVGAPEDGCTPGRLRLCGLQLAILVLLVLDVVTHTPNFNPTIAASEFEPSLWQHSRATAPPKVGESRVMITPRAEQMLLFSAETNLARDFLAKRLALWSNLNLLDGIAKVNGSSTLQLREQKQIESLLYANPNHAAPGLVNFLGVSHCTAPDYAIEWSTRSNYCPLITCGQQPVFATPQQTLEALAAPDFDSTKTVFFSPDAKPLVTVSHGTVAKIVRSDFSAQRVEIEVESQGPGLLVIAQSFYDAWHASIDGRPVPLLRANHAFQALQVPTGSSHVSLRYQDRGLWLGAIVSGLTALICLIWWRRAGADSSLMRGPD